MRKAWRSTGQRSTGEGSLEEYREEYRAEKWMPECRPEEYRRGGSPEVARSGGITQYTQVDRWPLGGFTPKTEFSTGDTKIRLSVGDFP